MKPEDFSKYWETGYNIGGGIEFPISSSISLIGLIDYYLFNFDRDKFLIFNYNNHPLVSIRGGTTSIFNTTCNIKSILSTKYNSNIPYAFIGLGFLNLSTDDVSVSYSGRDFIIKGNSKHMINFLSGIGVEFHIDNLTDLFFEILYNIGYTKDKSTLFIPIKAGLKTKI